MSLEKRLESTEEFDIESIRDLLSIHVSNLDHLEYFINKLKSKEHLLEKIISDILQFIESQKNTSSKDAEFRYRVNSLQYAFSLLAKELLPDKIFNQIVIFFEVSYSIPDNMVFSLDQFSIMLSKYIKYYTEKTTDANKNMFDNQLRKYRRFSNLLMCVYSMLILKKKLDSGENEGNENIKACLDSITRIKEILLKYNNREDLETLLESLKNTLKEFNITKALILGNKIKTLLYLKEFNNIRMGTPSIIDELSFLLETLKEIQY